MQIPKPTPEDIDRFHALVPSDPRVTVKPMFGNLGAFVNGNMFLGLLGSDIGVKLAPKDAEQLRAIDGARPFGPPDRPMGGYVVLPAALVEGPDASRWVERSIAYVGSLPPKTLKK